jgi:hypothetical protein
MAALAAVAAPVLIGWERVPGASFMGRGAEDTTP